ncbi:heparan sulfate glucosamine 3-O-sulfotransferase 6-like [Dysidea avara]|uniref:heparan sulfate glucosamine 3-O-sulfotransferase 6-like n=1 Tax=Dysidea avara TaxID=196820 RepID=UPI00331C20CA
MVIDEEQVNFDIQPDCNIDRFEVTDPQRKKFPRLFIIGFPKGGTYAISESLQIHPNIIGNNGKEMKFFNNLFTMGLCWYIDQFRDPGPSQVVMEDSPTYVIDCPVVIPRLIRAIKYFQLRFSELKFIIIVRHPIARAISQYVQWKLHHLNVSKTFDEIAVNATGHPNLELYSIATTRYSYYIKQCLEFIPSNQICFVNGDMLRTNPVLLMNKLEKCLGLPSNISLSNFVYNKERKLYCFVKDNTIKCPSIKSKGRPHPKITRRTADILMKFYEPYNKELYEITGEDYGWDYNYDEIDIIVQL